MLNISIVGSVGVPACYGGFETMVDNLLDYTPNGVKYTVFCSSKSYPERRTNYKNALLQYVNLNPNGVSSIFYDIFSLWKSRKSEIIILLGVSGCIFLPFFRLVYKGRILTNIDGIEWKRDKWNIFVKKYLHISEKYAVVYSDIIIGDNKAITDYVMINYNKKAALIEYGANHVYPINSEKYITEYPFLLQDYAISVCRIEPENNIDKILQAYAGSQLHLKLVIVGNWLKSNYGRVLFRKYSKINNIILLNSIYDSDKINVLRSNAKLYIHGHSAGGTNPSLVEAMNLSVNICAFDCIYNRETTENVAEYWKNIKDLSYLLKNYNKINNREQMNRIAKTRYTWEEIAHKYCNLY